MASLVFSAGGLGDEAGGLRPPLASPASMPRMRARHWYSASGSGFGSRHGVFLLSFVYKSTVFLLLYRQTIELLRSFSFALNNRVPPVASPHK